MSCATYDCTFSGGALSDAVLVLVDSTLVAFASRSFSFCWRFRRRVAGTSTRPGVGGIQFAGVRPPVGRLAPEFGFFASGFSSTSLSPDTDNPSSPRSIILCFSCLISSTKPSMSYSKLEDLANLLRCFRFGVVSVSAGDGIPFEVVLRELTFDFVPLLRFDLVVFFDTLGRLFRWSAGAIT